MYFYHDFAQRIFPLNIFQKVYTKVVSFVYDFVKNLAGKLVGRRVIRYHLTMFERAQINGLESFTLLY